MSVIHYMYTYFMNSYVIHLLKYLSIISLQTLKAIHNIVTQFQLQFNLSDFFILHAGMDIFYLKVVMVNIGVQRINNF
jgi:hypothetical protein